MTCRCRISQRCVDCRRRSITNQTITVYIHDPRLYRLLIQRFAFASTEIPRKNTQIWLHKSVYLGAAVCLRVVAARPKHWFRNALLPSCIYCVLLRNHTSAKTGPRDDVPSKGGAPFGAQACSNLRIVPGSCQRRKQIWRTNIPRLIAPRFRFVRRDGWL